jgi:Tol biopolymer transport system component
MVVLSGLCGFAALAISMSDRGGAAFPGLNGRIAYANGDAYSGAIWSANADGSSPARLTGGSGDYAPSYSANGGRIAFEREGGIAAMNADGSGLTQIAFGNSSFTPEVEWEENYKPPKHPSETIPFVKITTYTEIWHTFNSPSFSPDGSQIAARESSGKGVYKNICAVEEAEGQECISGYGSGSFFESEAECFSCVGHIVTLNSSNGALSGEVSPATTTNGDYEPTYSSTGKIAFSRWTEGGDSAIFVVDSPGAPPAQVTAGPTDYAPDFSPDGSRIAFIHGSREIGVIGAGGGPLTVLPVPNPPGVPYSYVGSPVFSPDGSRFAFERTIFPSGGKSEHGIYTMAADGTGLTRVLEGFGPDWQAVSPPPPPPPTAAKAKAKKGKVKLGKTGKGTVGTITCGSSPCTLEVLSARLKAGKTTCSVRTKLAKKLAPGKSAPLGVKVAGKCLAALREAGRGRLFAKVRVTDALGNHLLTLKATLVAPAAKKGKREKRAKR